MSDAAGLPRPLRPTRRLGPSGTLSVSLLLAVLSTLPPALTCAAAFAMSLQAPESPVNGGPLPGTLWYPVLLMAGLFSALALSPVVLLIAMFTGSIYLRRVTISGRRWRIAWVGAAALGAVVETLYVRAAVKVVWPAAASGLSRPDWGSAMLSAGFVTVGVAIIAVLVIAARSATSPATSAAALG